MRVTIGDYEFDRVDYDERNDVLCLRAVAWHEIASAAATPEGHVVGFDERGDVTGMTLVNAKWLIDATGSCPSPSHSALRLPGGPGRRALIPSGASDRFSVSSEAQPLCSALAR